MSDEKERLEKLSKRVDEILTVLNKISEDVEGLSKSIKLALGVNVGRSSTLTPIIKSSDKGKTINEIRIAFPKELEKLLEFKEKTDYIIIKPRQFLGSENFAKIASIARELGGEYISAGRDSHFRVAKS
ncbi:MAG: hypothetical protein NWF10_05535 [Candidatus Bathyarchaeota archaeon]|nr:hypothetical protein [Candidatus Bathyarchaeota archaeon]